MHVLLFQSIVTRNNIRNNNIMLFLAAMFKASNETAVVIDVLQGLGIIYIVANP